MGETLPGQGILRQCRRLRRVLACIGPIGDYATLRRSIGLRVLELRHCPGLCIFDPHPLRQFPEPLGQGIPGTNVEFRRRRSGREIQVGITRGKLESYDFGLADIMEIVDGGEWVTVRTTVGGSSKDFGRAPHVRGRLSRIPGVAPLAAGRPRNPPAWLKWGQRRPPQRDRTTRTAIPRGGRSEGEPSHPTRRPPLPPPIRGTQYSIVALNLGSFVG